MTNNEFTLLFIVKFDLELYNIIVSYYFVDHPSSKSALISLHEDWIWRLPIIYILYIGICLCVCICVYKVVFHFLSIWWLFLRYFSMGIPNFRSALRLDLSFRPNWSGYDGEGGGRSFFLFLIWWVFLSQFSTEITNFRSALCFDISISWNRSGYVGTPRKLV